MLSDKKELSLSRNPRIQDWAIAVDFGPLANGRQVKELPVQRQKRQRRSMKVAQGMFLKYRYSEGGEKPDSTALRVEKA